jgi:hypothetical protein
MSAIPLMEDCLRSEKNPLAQGLENMSGGYLLPDVVEGEFDVRIVGEEVC